jgi:hypothetical protein
MDIRVDIDADEDLPDSHSIDSREKAENFMRMMEGTIQSLMEESEFVEDAGRIAVNLEATVDGSLLRFSLNDERWCILCHNCYEIVAVREEAQVARRIFNEHIDSERNGCIDRGNRTILNNYGKLESMRDAMRGDE